MKRLGTVATRVVLAALLTAFAGCSSSTSPSAITDWFLDAFWQTLSDFPNGSYYGAALEWDGDDAVYALRGWDAPDGNQFWRYDVSTDDWTQLGDTPFSAFWGASLAYIGGDHMYALQGNGTDAFYRCTISTDNWDSMESFPESGVRRTGRSLAWPGSGDYVYGIKGNETDVFARYSISGDS
jgi:hypothetical protein